MNVNVKITDTPTLRKGFSTVTVEVPDLSISEVLDIDFEEIALAFASPIPSALDLLLVAGIVYTLDKTVPRRIAGDLWTREFSVTFPVHDPQRWENGRNALQEALEFLTGDEWQVDFARRPDVLYTPPSKPRNKPKLVQAEAVSLFSGGLDSLVGILDLLNDSDVRVVLVGHHDANGPGGDQRRLHERLESSKKYERRTDRLSVRMRPLPPSNVKVGQFVSQIGREHTLRSRSLVFISLGLYAAAALGDRVPLLIPENGVIALNVPLTPSRIGTCSTRTTHPYFLLKIGELATSIGIRNKFANPLELKTKGEILDSCSDRHFLQQLIPETVSCSHPSRRGTWTRRSARNCGYCVPCLIRRSALHHIGEDNGLDYGMDVCSGELSLFANVSSDLRAVLSCLYDVPLYEEIEDRVKMTGPISREMLGPYSKTVSRGLDEIRALIRDKGVDELRQFAGLQ